MERKMRIDEMKARNAYFKLTDEQRDDLNVNLFAGIVHDLGLTEWSGTGAVTGLDSVGRKGLVYTLNINGREFTTIYTWEQLHEAMQLG